MNYLAHIYLSKDDDLLKIGNFAADSIKGKSFLKYPERMRTGITLHRAIDTYTDSHPIVRESVSRLFPKYSQYRTLIVDILYDHYLAKNWNDFHPQPLSEYVNEFYTLLENQYSILPKRVQSFLPVMTEHNWLLSYATIDGIGKILYQMNIRTKRRSDMHLAVYDLQKFYSEFEKEFRTFFEDLETYVEDLLPTLLSHENLP
jgi:acyl carrier protein phosphodiesterase